MGIEYFIFALDDAITEQDILAAFAPYWTKKDQDYYALDYDALNHCHLMINYDEAHIKVTGFTIYKPCGHIQMDQAIFQLIRHFSMFMTYPTSPLIIIVANQRSIELIKQLHPELEEDLVTVHSFDEYCAHT